MDDGEIKTILQKTGTIALVGASPNAERPSYMVMQYLLDHGYRVIPVNPGQAGKQILGQTVYASLSDIPEKVDMVDVFRASAAVPSIVEEMIGLAARPDVLWLQLDVSDPQAEAKARAAGITVVGNMCTKQQHQRLLAQ